MKKQFLKKIVYAVLLLGTTQIYCPSIFDKIDAADTMAALQKLYKKAQFAEGGNAAWEAKKAELEGGSAPAKDSAPVDLGPSAAHQQAAADTHNHANRARTAVDQVQLAANTVQQRIGDLGSARSKADADRYIGEARKARGDAQNAHNNVEGHYNNAQTSHGIASGHATTKAQADPDMQRAADANSDSLAANKAAGDYLNDALAAYNAKVADLTKQVGGGVGGAPPPPAPASAADANKWEACMHLAAGIADGDADKQQDLINAANNNLGAISADASAYMARRSHALGRLGRARTKEEKARHKKLKKMKKGEHNKEMEKRKKADKKRRKKANKKRKNNKRGKGRKSVKGRGARKGKKRRVRGQAVSNSRSSASSRRPAVAPASGSSRKGNSSGSNGGSRGSQAGSNKGNSGKKNVQGTGLRDKKNKRRRREAATPSSNRYGW